LTWSHGADIINTPLNQSVIFIKEADVTFTSDYWKVAISFKLAPYEKAIEILHADLTPVIELAHHTPLIDEVHQIQSAVKSLEGKLSSLKQFLPRAERKRGLMNIGGTFLKVLFGTATTTDLADLHATVDTLSHKQGEVIHAVNQQLTYFKQMESTVKFDHEALANWSFILRDFATKSQEKFQKTVTRLEWAMKLQEATTAVRQLEFSLTQLELQINELLEAVQILVTGKFPPRLIQFNVLQDILRNVTLNLPQGYELVMGTQFNNMPWYVKHVKAALLADLNSYMLVLYFPFTMADRKYELFKVIAFPLRILNTTHVRFGLDTEYFAISTLRQFYISLSEREMRQCEGDNVMVCPANKAVKSTRTETCVLSLFLQRRNVQECHRVVTAKQPPAMLERHSTLVLYFTPEPQTAHLRCRDSRGEWTTDNILLNGAGSLSGVQSCHITWGDMQLYAEIRGNSQFEAPNPQIIIPSQFPVVSDKEWETLKQITETKGLDQLIAAVTAHKMETSVDELVKIHQSEPPQTYNSTWTTPLLLAMSCLLVAMLLYYCVHSHLPALTTWCLHIESQDARTPCTHNGSSQEPIPPSASTTSEAPPVQSTSSQGYATYAIQRE